MFYKSYLVFFPWIIWGSKKYGCINVLVLEGLDIENDVNNLDIIKKDN